MAGAPLRTASVPIRRLNFAGSPRPGPRREIRNDAVFSPVVSFRHSADRKHGIRRSISDTNVIRFGCSRIPRVGSAPFVSPIVDADEEIEVVGDLRLDNGVPLEENDFAGGGFGSGRRYGGNGGSGGRKEDRSEMSEYYQRMLKSNPGDSLLLRNYGKYLHEVENDVVRAEECYGRAILCTPGDGELLCLYGSLIWESRRDGERARSYFDQAVRAAPDDCTVLGSYAHFLWEAEEEEEEGKQAESTASTAAMACP